MPQQEKGLPPAVDVVVVVFRRSDDFSPLVRSPTQFAAADATLLTADVDVLLTSRAPRLERLTAVLPRGGRWSAEDAAARCILRPNSALPTSLHPPPSLHTRPPSLFPSSSDGNASLSWAYVASCQ